MKKVTILFLVTSISITSVFAQHAINTNGSSPDYSAALDISSTTKGVLIPRMTNNQIQIIASPADGLMIFSTDDSKVYCYHSGDNEWKGMDYGTGIITPYCGEPIVDVRDGQSYNTIQIGTQCWMTENLNIGTRTDGINNQTDNSTIEKYCYNDEDVNCATYGGLYQWDEMMQYITTEGSQGICPNGWHIPTDAEYTTLTTYLGGISIAGGKMKETGTTHWNSPNTGATNESGFTALPGGYRNTNGSFGTLASNAHFWSSSEYGSYQWLRYLVNNDAQVIRLYGSPAYGFSVRCIKD